MWDVFYWAEFLEFLSEDIAKEATYICRRPWSHIYLTFLTLVCGVQDNRKISNSVALLPEIYFYSLLTIYVKTPLPRPVKKNHFTWDGAVWRHWWILHITPAKFNYSASRHLRDLIQKRFYKISSRTVYFWQNARLLHSPEGLVEWNWNSILSSKHWLYNSCQEYCKQQRKTNFYTVFLKYCVCLS